jgi:simple sugar transport system ATP-binding protein
VTAAKPLPAPALELRGIVKRYPGVLANDGVDLTVRWGEVHAILGENGAGKSTLVQVAYGFTRPDAGAILVEGREIRPGSPVEARRAGLGMVFQRPTLIPAFTVTENVALVLPGLEARPDLGALAERVTATAQRYGLAVDPAARAGQLTAGEQQRVEILKLLFSGARILIFDEPTSVLSPHEVDLVYEVLERLRRDGHAIVLITHGLAEAMKAAGEITVMRRGRVTGTLASSEATERQLLELMFGTAPAGRPRRDPRAAEAGAEALELSGVATLGTSERPLHDLDLVVRAGEIVGVAGVAGNGQRELGDLILGIVRPVSGTKRLFARDASAWSVAKVREAGVAFVPEDAAATGAIWSLTAVENELVTAGDRYVRWGGLALDRSAARAEIVGALERLGVRDLPLERPVATLSGGNVQRFVFAKELDERTRLVVALYPTKGLDARTTAAAQVELLRARSRGVGVLLVSQDLDELFALADRIVVMRGGSIVASFAPEDVNPYEVGRAMTGEAA